MTQFLFKFSIMMWVIEGIQAASYACIADIPAFITHGFYMFLWSLLLQKQSTFRRKSA